MMRKMSLKAGLLISLTFLLTAAFLLTATEGASADRFVTVNMDQTGPPPKVFIVTKNAAGQEVRRRVSANSKKTAIPKGARVEIADADPHVKIRLEGAVEVKVLGGSPQLYLVGDTQLVVSEQVRQLAVRSEAGNSMVIIGGKDGRSLPLSAGQQLEITHVNNQHSIKIGPAPSIQEGFRVLAGPPSTSPARSAIEVVPVGAPRVTTGDTGLQVPAAPKTRGSVGTILSPDEIELLNSLTISKKETKLPPSLSPSPGLPPSTPEDPFASLEKISPAAVTALTPKTSTPKSTPLPMTHELETFLKKRDELIKDAEELLKQSDTTPQASS